GKNVELLSMHDAGLGILSDTANFDLTLTTSTAPAVTVTGGTVKVVQITNATGGNFTLTFDGATTSPLTFGASASTVQSALQGLGTMAPRQVMVTKTGNTYTVAFFTTSVVNASQQAGDQSETAVAVDPANPNRIVLGVNDADPVDGIFGSSSSSDHV